MFDTYYEGTSHGLSQEQEGALVHTVVQKFGGYDQELPGIVAACVRRVARGLNLSDKQVRILINIVRNRDFSLTVLRTAQGALGPGHHALRMAYDSMERFGALTQDQKDSLLDAVAEWANSEHVRKWRMLTKDELASLDNQERTPKNWAVASVSAITSGLNI